MEQLEVPIRDPRGFYFPLSEGSCGSNPLVPIGDSSAGQHAPLFQPVLSNGHTVSISKSSLLKRVKFTFDMHCSIWGDYCMVPVRVSSFDQAGL
jgi:hypothetical protein